MKNVDNATEQEHQPLTRTRPSEQQSAKRHAKHGVTRLTTLNTTDRSQLRKAQQLTRAWRLLTLLKFHLISFNKYAKQKHRSPTGPMQGINNELGWGEVITGGYVAPSAAWNVVWHHAAMTTDPWGPPPNERTPGHET